ncbi:DUF6647 family protein [Nioella aestuarii]|uniref:DUF6647 family protein n=1 Tax=Nioella aestuarii TaxID=1662864 RepID=UPI003D7F61EA
MIFSFRASRRLVRSLTLCVALVLSPETLAAQDLLAWREARTMQDLVDQMEDWLDTHTDLPRRATSPRIQLTDHAHVASMSQDHRAAASPTLRGLYDPDEEAIWLVRPWDACNPYDVSTLLHELVHHRQAEAGHWYCPGAQELPAYRIQQAWLNDLGLEPDVNWIAVVIEAGCTPRDIHPD